MRFAGPFLLIIGPFAGAFLALLFNRWRRISTIIGVVATWWQWVMVVTLPLTPTTIERMTRWFSGDTFLIFGQSMIITEGIRSLVLFLYAGASFLFLLSFLFPQGRYFVSGTLASLAPLAALLMIESVVIRVLLLLMAIAIISVVIQSDKAGSTQASLRYLLMGILALPTFLVAGWMLSGEQLTVVRSALNYLLIGIVILSAGFPFHIWVRPIVTESSPLVLPFVFGLVQLVITAFIFDLVITYPWLKENDVFIRALGISGLVTVLLAGILAVIATDFNRLLGALLLLDLGMSVLFVAIGGYNGWQTAVVTHISRFVSLILAGIGIGLMRSYGFDGELQIRQGLGRKVPVAISLFAYGSLSLLGMPLTLSFGSRWELLSHVRVAIQIPGLPYLLLLAMIAGLFGLLKALIRLLARTDEATVSFKKLPYTSWLSVIILVIGIWFALFPQVLYTYAFYLADLLK